MPRNILRAAAAVINKHYVDDYLDTFEIVQEATSVVNEVKLVYFKQDSKGGFTLRHFSSIEAKYMSIFGKRAKTFGHGAGKKSETVLGMQWIPHEDVFVYALGLREDLQYILDENHIPRVHLLFPRAW